MKIEWLGHSCFRVSHKDYSLVLDPYKESETLRLKSLHTSGHMVICSHNHSDHNYVDAVDIQASKQEDIFRIQRLETYHDQMKGIRRGKNFMTIISNESYKLAHLGDLGCALNTSEIEQLQDLDVLMIPVGGYYTIGPKEAKEICDLLQAKVIIPMHYKGENFGPSVLAKVDEFLNLFVQKDIVRYKENFIILEQIDKAHIAVLSYN